MVEQIYNNLLKDIQIRKIYDEIGYLEAAEGGWAYHNYDHIKNVTNFITDNNIDIKEVNEYYFTKKVFKAIESFSNKMNLKYIILMDNKEWIIE